MAGRAPAGAAERGIRTGSHSGAPSPASPESSRRTDQAEPKVADFGQQPVQRGLISERAANDRLRAVIAEVETLEPGGPMAVEDTVDADLVTRGLSGGAHARAPRGGKPAPGRAAAAPAVRAEAGRGAGTSAAPAGPIVVRVSLSAVITVPSVGTRLVPPERYERSRGVASPEGAHAGGIFRSGVRHERAGTAAVTAGPAGQSSRAYNGFAWRRGWLSPHALRMGR
jgi:hypothetical protein